MLKKLLTVLVAFALFVISVPVVEVAALVIDMNVSYTDLTDSSVDISWDAVEGNVHYDIWLNGSWLRQVETAGLTTDRLTNLSDNTEYTVKVTARDSLGNDVGEGSCTFTTLSGPSDNPGETEGSAVIETPGEAEESASTEAPGEADQKEAVSTVDMNITAKNIIAESADVTWDAVDGAYIYALTYNDSETIEIAAPETSYSLTGLTPDTEYSVKITAYSTEDAVIGEGTKSFTTDPVQAPKKVKNFRTVSSYQSVILKWKKSKDADGYKIYWTGNNGKKGTIKIKSNKTTSYKFKISEANRKVKYTFKIAAVKDGVSSKKVTKKDSAVQLMQLEITLRVNKNLKNHDKPIGKYSINLKAGTKIKTIGFTNGKYVFRKKVKGKLRTFYVMRIATRNQKVDYIGSYTKKNGWRVVKPKIAYTKEEAESFINTLGVRSNTKHLIWVNQYTQRLYIFKGKKGKWKLIKQCYKDGDDGYPGWPVASGKPSSPTSTGLTSIKQRDLGGGGKVPFWNVTTWFSIHGNSPGPWGPLGWPKSGACTRNTTPHAKWIYYNTKMHTSVYVY